MASAFITVASMPIESARARSIPLLAPWIPRKKFPPPTTTASSAPVSTASTRSDAMRATVGACRPCASGPVSASPDSLTTTRLNIPAPLPDIMSCCSFFNADMIPGPTRRIARKKGGIIDAASAYRAARTPVRTRFTRFGRALARIGVALDQAGDFGREIRRVGLAPRPRPAHSERSPSL